MLKSVSGRVGGAGGCPSVRARLVTPAGIQKNRVIPSTPDDHLAAGPDCRMKAPSGGRAGCAGSCPAIGAGLYLPPLFKAIATEKSAPDDHLAAGPDCRVSYRAGARQWCWWRSNCPCWDCISRRCSNRMPIVSTPDDHFTASPHSRVILSGTRRVGGAGGCPTVRARIVSPAGVQSVAAIISSPDDHFAASPHCHVARPRIRRVGGARGRPTVRAWIVSPASVKIDGAADPRPRRSFHCQSKQPCDRPGHRARWS